MLPALRGVKVRLRERNPVDFLRESLWSADPEVTALDPSAGLYYSGHFFAIETVEGTHIGMCSLSNFDGYQVQLGIRIGDKNYWNKGYGTDAMKLLINHCLTAVGAQRLWVKVLSENVRAQRCYEKCGFGYCGKAVVDKYEFIIMERR